MDTSIHIRNVRNKAIAAGYRQWRNTPNLIYIDSPNTFSRDAARLVGINSYPYNGYPNLGKIMCKSVYWCAGLI